MTGVLRPVCQPFQLHDTCKTKQNSTNQIIGEDSKLKKKVTCPAWRTATPFPVLCYENKLFASIIHAKEYSII